MGSQWSREELLDWEGQGEPPAKVGFSNLVLKPGWRGLVERQRKVNRRHPTTNVPVSRKICSQGTVKQKRIQDVN